MRVFRDSFRLWEGEAPAEPVALRKRLSRSFALPVALATLLNCTGCWEEIHYVPKSGAVQAAVENDENAEQAAEEPAAAAISEPETAEPLVEAADAPTLPEADELFTSQGPAEITVENLGPEIVASETPATEDSILPTPDGLAAELGEALAGEREGARAETARLAPSTEERRWAWEAASKWSLAAAFHAKGRVALQQTNLDEATAAAARIDIDLPPLPTSARAEELEATVIDALRGESAVALTNAFANRFGAAEAAAADLAIRSHLLLLTYSPRTGDAALQAEALRRAAESSALPADAWEPLVELLDDRGRSSPSAKRYSRSTTASRNTSPRINSPAILAGSSPGQDGPAI